MRRSYISPEFDHNDVYGTFNMIEESNFFGSKMLEIEDSIYIDVQNLIYYQNSKGEQIDFSSESTLDSNVYSSSDSKRKYQRLTIDESQSNYTKDNSTRWILDINLKSILIDFLYAELKRWRTFEGISNNMTINNDVNSSLKNYISNNVLDRYKFSKVDIYLEYNDMRSNSLFKFKNTWDNSVYKIENKLIKFETETQFDGSSIRVMFNQEKPSTLYNFNYYFNILFEKI
jgi:hypothetical protein